MIRIDENYRIETSGAGCTLVRSKTTTREVDGVAKYFTVVDDWHFLNVEQCLNRYLDLVAEPCKSVKEVLMAIKEARLTIKNLKS